MLWDSVICLSSKASVNSHSAKQNLQDLLILVFFEQSIQDEHRNKKEKNPMSESSPRDSTKTLTKKWQNNQKKYIVAHFCHIYLAET